MTALTVGSLFAGMGALDLAVHDVFGARTIWLAEYEPPTEKSKRPRNAGARVLAHRFPGVPNLGDVMRIDWSSVPRPDILAAGYPCFVAGTLILTRDGYRPIEDIHVDDEVLTHRGRWRRVTLTMSRDNAELWRVKAGNTLITTAEHPFYATLQQNAYDPVARQVRRQINSPEWVDAKNLVPWRHRVGQVLPPAEEPEETDLAIWWLAGRYLADGHRQQRAKTGAGNPVTSDQGKVVISCGAGKEGPLRAKVAEAGLRAYEDKVRNVTKFIICGQRLYRFTSRFGRGAGNKRIPADALALPKKYARALLGGWLAGDGCSDAHGWVGSTISKELAFGLAIIAHRALDTVPSVRLRIPAPTTVIEGRTVNQRPSWSVSFPHKPPRKNIWDGAWGWRFVTESAPTGETGAVYNISVADDESYVADGTVVHNCQSQSQSGKRRGQADERWLWPAYRSAIRALRPRWALGENVEGHVTLDLRHVIADLQEDGYAVAWVTMAASDVGACHQRRRVFWLAWPQEHGAPVWASRSPFAHLSAGQWGVDGLFGVEPVGQWAYQGAAYQGAAPTPSLLPTVRTTDTNGIGAHGDGGLDLRTTIADLLPTCTARDVKGGTTPAGHVRADGRVRTEGDYGLPMVIEHLLPTPNASLGDTHRGGWPNRDVAAARLAQGKRYLDDAISVLLPTPAAADSERTSGAYARGNATLLGATARLLPTPTPTPTVTDANGGRNATAGRTDPDSRHHAGTTLCDAVWSTEDWQQYAPAIARHEAVLGRVAPAPTGPYGRKGEQRLCGRFTEWMLMLPEGWVTDVPGVTNKDAIRLCGNGVVRAQAAAAYRFLLAVVGAEVAA